MNNGTTTLTSTDQNPILSFNSEGIYNITHDVNNGLGTSSKTGNQRIHVTAPVTVLPANTLTSTNNGDHSNNYIKLNTIEKTFRLCRLCKY